MTLLAETDARSLVSAVVLIVLMGLLGVVLVVGLMVAWRRSLERHRMRSAHQDEAPDAWQEAARRLDTSSQDIDLDAEHGRDGGDIREPDDDLEDPFGRNP